MKTHPHAARALLSCFTVIVVVMAGAPAVAAAPATTVTTSTTVVTLAADDEPPTDSDGDGVTDDVDLCPDTPGSQSYNGCLVPDSDGDGVYDDVDQCVSEPGQAQYNGCQPPDSDGDGITDDVDACPTLPGAYDGCPLVDFDGDGVTDDIDLCPNVYGTTSNFGCPEDNDNDGVVDDNDGCPGTPQGENVDSVGCSLTQLDSDNDGVDDEHDACVSTPSDTQVDETGCPLVVTADPVLFANPCGHGNDSFVVPSTPGVVYRRHGEVIAAGTYPGRHTIRIKAVAAAGHTLVGKKSWKKTFSDHRCRLGRVSVSSPGSRVLRVVNREDQTLTFVFRGHASHIKPGATRTFTRARGSSKWHARWADFYADRRGSVRVR